MGDNYQQYTRDQKKEKSFCEMYINLEPGLEKKTCTCVLKTRIQSNTNSRLSWASL